MVLTKKRKSPTYLTLRQQTAIILRFEIIVCVVSSGCLCVTDQYSLLQVCRLWRFRLRLAPVSFEGVLVLLHNYDVANLKHCTLDCWDGQTGMRRTQRRLMANKTYVMPDPDAPDVFSKEMSTLVESKTVLQSLCIRNANFALSFPHDLKVHRLQLENCCSYVEDLPDSVQTFISTRSHLAFTRTMLARKWALRVIQMAVSLPQHCLHRDDQLVASEMRLERTVSQQLLEEIMSRDWLPFLSFSGFESEIDFGAFFLDAAYEHATEDLPFESTHAGKPVSVESLVLINTSSREDDFVVRKLGFVSELRLQQKAVEDRVLSSFTSANLERISLHHVKLKHGQLGIIAQYLSLDHLTLEQNYGLSGDELSWKELARSGISSLVVRQLFVTEELFWLAVGLCPNLSNENIQLVIAEQRRQKN
jgi:hypothetical protein